MMRQKGINIYWFWLFVKGKYWYDAYSKSLINIKIKLRWNVAMQ